MIFEPLYRWLVEGWMPVGVFEDTLGLCGRRGTGGFHTVAGLVLHHLGHVPVAGEVFERDGVWIEVVDMHGRRIDKVLIVPQLDPSAVADE